MHLQRTLTRRMETRDDSNIGTSVFERDWCYIERALSREQTMGRGIAALIVLSFLAMAILSLVDQVRGDQIAAQHWYFVVLWWTGGFCATHVFFMLLSALKPMRRNSCLLLREVWMVPMAGTWSLGFMLTFHYWGWAALIPSLLAGGVGPIPAGWLASITHGLWLSTIFISTAFIISLVSRYVGFLGALSFAHQAGSAESQR